MTDAEREQLRAAILARHKSVYAFCKAHAGRIGKSVVVLLLAGRYPGNVSRQAARLRALVQGFAPAAPGMPEPDDIMGALRNVACKHCTKPRKRKRCQICRDIWREQTAAILALQGGQHE